MDYSMEHQWGSIVQTKSRWPFTQIQYFENALHNVYFSEDKNVTEISALEPLPQHSGLKGTTPYSVIYDPTYSCRIHHQMYP